MRFIPLLPAALVMLLTAACSQAQSDNASGAAETATADSPKGGDRRKDKDAAAAIAGLRKVGSLKGSVPESSGLAVGSDDGPTYYSFGDDGNSPTLYEISSTGKLLGTLAVPATNHDWESLSRDNGGSYYIGDCGNNENDRRDLKIYKFNPKLPQSVATIAFTYPDQREFSPKKKQRNVYSVPDQPGSYTAKRVTALAIPGQVTDATLRPDGHRLVLLGRGELFILDGNSWADILKAAPRKISLAGAGQTEGAAFINDTTLLISTEQGGLYEFTLP